MVIYFYPGVSMAKKVFIIADGKAKQKERRFSRPLDDKKAQDAPIANPDVAEAKASSTEAPSDHSIIARHTKNPGEVFARIKKGDFRFVMAGQSVDCDRFVVIEHGKGKGRVALCVERFDDEEEYARQAAFWQERYGIAIDDSNRGLARIQHIAPGACRFRWHDSAILVHLKHFSKPYVFPVTLIRMAGPNDIRRMAMHCFAVFVRRQKNKAETAP
jgi:hypothetical protein